MRSGDESSAEENAKLALIKALAELQKAAGPDQRVSAVAGILGEGGLAPQAGSEQWVGIWDTEKYDPRSPNDKAFVQWLVSTKEDAQNVGLASQTLGGETVEIFNGGGYSESVQVEKVKVNNGSQVDGYYAYWVSDESGKSDLTWTGVQSTDEREISSRRLRTGFGADYGVFLRGLSDAPMDFPSYPLAKANNTYLTGLEKAVTLETVSLAGEATGGDQQWYREYRHDVTMGSYGVIADVKKGGLRRDLSLAFEMDGEADYGSDSLGNLVTNAPIKFNAQEGEFVGGADGLEAPQVVPVVGLTERFLFRDSGAANSFSGDLEHEDTVVRGPNWWAMRDYANLYKRLERDGTDYRLAARAYFPNRISGTGGADVRDNLFDMHAHKNNADANYRIGVGNKEVNGQGRYAHMPVRGNYAPVILGVNAIYSICRKNGRLHLVVDPVFILWNPYDLTLEAERFAVGLENGLPGGLAFLVDGVRYGKKPSRKKYSNNGTDTSMADFAKNKSGSTASLSYMVSNLEMAPGEIRFYSPPSESERSSSATVLNDELTPGYALSLIHI